MIDHILPLEHIWPRQAVERLIERVSVSTRPSIRALRQALLVRPLTDGCDDPLVRDAVMSIARLRGMVSIEQLAAERCLSRQAFSQRFHRSTGLSPKRFARMTRFQVLVHGLLSADMSAWAEVAVDTVDTGFYDQSHMINEFRTLTGLPPTVFFQSRTNDQRYR